MVLYQYDRFQIVKENNAYKIQDPDDYENHHTHNIKSLKMAQTIIHNVTKKRKPFTRNAYLLESHIRLSKSKKYKEMIKRLIENEKDKQTYRDTHVFRACR